MRIRALDKTSEWRRPLWPWRIVSSALVACATLASAPLARSQETDVALASVSTAEELRGIVRLERGGAAVGFGMVLDGDGRILTALSALGHGNQLRARYADDVAAPVRVVVSERGADLALLEPDGIYWMDGLRPSSLEPDADGVVLRRYRARGRRLEPAPAPVARRLPLLGHDGAVMEGALLFGAPLREGDLGSPILDSAGQVVAVVAHACAPDSGEHCRLAPCGVPVGVLKRFLKTAPRRAPLPATWLGLRGEAGHVGQVAGVRVAYVQPDSPAHRAGLSGVGGQRSDLVVAVNGEPVQTWEELRDAVNRSALRERPARGDATSQAPASGELPRVSLLVFGAGRFRTVEVELQPPERRASVTPVSDGPAGSKGSSPPAPPVRAAVTEAPPRPAAPPRPRLAPTPYEPDAAPAPP